MTKKFSTKASSSNQISLFQAPEIRKEYKKAVQVVHSKPRAPLTLVQRKLSNAWLKHAVENPRDPDGFWSIPVSDMFVDIGYDSRNREHLRESARLLMSIVFEWDVLAKEGNKVKWKASVLFPDVEFTSSHVRYRINDQMEAQVLKPDIYATIDMAVVAKFRRASSLALYEFCTRFIGIGKTAEIRWELMRDMLLGESSESGAYAEFKNFKQKILKPSIAEVNSQADITVELLEPTKNGRKIVGIQFSVTRNRPLEVEGAIDDERKLHAIAEMVKVGIPQSEAKRLAREYKVEEITAALDYLRSQQAQRSGEKIRNPAAYLRHSLRKRYAIVDASAKPTANSMASTPVTKKAGSNKILEQYMSHQLKQAEAYFKELDAADQEALIARYNAQQDLAGLKILKKPGKAATAAFFTWLGLDTWGEPSQAQLLDFVDEVLLA